MKTTPYIFLFSAILLSQVGVSQNIEISFNENPGPISVCANNLPNLALTAATTSLDTANCDYTYSWSILNGNGNITPNVNNPLIADYSFHVSPATSITIEIEGIPSGDDCEQDPFEDTIVINVTSAPVVNPGGPYSVCANNPQVSLNGSVTVANEGIWSGGNGTFSNVNPANATASYMPTQTEINTGNVTLTLTSDDNGNCSAVSENVIVTITPAPVVNPGGPYSVCANNAQVSLNGSVTVANEGIWSGGNGTFTNVNPANATASYMPTQTEINTGNVTLTLTSDDNGNCNAVSENVVVTFTPAPVVNPGGPYSVCSNDADVSLNGSVTVAPGGIWSGGNGTFTNVNLANATASYMPTQLEINTGNVTLTLTSTAIGNCVAVSQTAVININDAYSVETFNYGSGIFCDNDLSEIVPEFSGTSTGNSIFGCASCDSFDTQTGSFVPGENVPGTYSITYSIPAAGGCEELNTSTTITINPAPLVSAEATTYPHSDLCNSLPIDLQGSAQNSTGVTWTVDGANGSFDDETSLNSTFTLSGNYTGELQFDITAEGLPGCASASDSYTFNLIPAPEASVALLPDHLCTGDTVSLSISNTPFNTFYDIEWTANNIIGSNNNAQVQFMVDDSESVSVMLVQSINGTCLSETTYDIQVFQRPSICDYFELAGAILSVNPCDLEQDYFYQWGCGTSAIEGENDNYLLYSAYLDECNNDFYVAVSFYDTGVCPAYGGNDPTTSLEESDFSELFEVFPNPAADLIRLRLKVGEHTESTLYITDLKGRIMSQRVIQTGEAEILIHTSHFAAGSYLLTIQGDDWMARKTIVVIH